MMLILLFNQVRCVNEW